MNTEKTSFMSVKINIHRYKPSAPYEKIPMPEIFEITTAIAHIMHLTNSFQYDSDLWLNFIFCIFSPYQQTTFIKSQQNHKTFKGASIYLWYKLIASANLKIVYSKYNSFQLNSSVQVANCTQNHCILYHLFDVLSIICTYIHSTFQF